MGDKRFRTRRQWHNALLAVWASPFVVLTGVLIGMVTGLFWPLWCLLAALLGGFIVGLGRDRQSSIDYHMLNDNLVFVRGQDRLELKPEDIIDASLIDRAGARDYIRNRVAARSAEAGHTPKTMQNDYLRFCTVDIGLRTYTFGLGRGMIDRMPNAKHDLVLLRLRKGTDLVLSPEYNQEMVDSIGRMLRRQGGIGV